MKKIVHIVTNEKFANPFYNLIKENFNQDEHLFIYLSGSPESLYAIPKFKNVVNLNKKFNKFYNYLKLRSILQSYFRSADKIIVHGLFSKNLIYFFYFNKQFLSKSFWIMWGGDLYPSPHDSRKKNILRSLKKLIIKKVKGGFFGYITYIKGDFELAKNLFNAKGESYESFSYLSNVFKPMPLSVFVANNIKTILVGNSAHQTSNHEDVFKKLNILKDQNFKVICPLSYGSKSHAKKISELGFHFFGERFVPLMDFMSLDDYLKILAKVDIAIFAHKRQQAMGNTVNLLGMGKTVYMNSDVTHYSFFKELGVTIFDYDNLRLDLLDKKSANKNRHIISNYFSKSNLIGQLHNIFKV
jgi:dTDP-N-acetylfucosamine:lipid II N-acetylfucosaminyltransferase